VANHIDRVQLLGASILAIIVAAGTAPAIAQDAPQPGAPQAETAPQDDAPSTIVVTGFRAAL
jgi:iron complex outermembrane recepter protein